MTGPHIVEEDFVFIDDKMRIISMSSVKEIVMTCIAAMLVGLSPHPTSLCSSTVSPFAKDEASKLVESQELHVLGILKLYL